MLSKNFSLIVWGGDNYNRDIIMNRLLKFLSSNKEEHQHFFGFIDACRISEYSISQAMMWSNGSDSFDM